MTFVALPLVLPIDTMTPRKWSVVHAPGQGPQNYLLAIQIHGDREAQALSAHLSRFYGPSLGSEVT